MILILNNPWVKEYLAAVTAAIDNEIEENRDDVIGTKISRLLGLKATDDRPNGMFLTALIMHDIGLYACDFTAGILEGGSSLIKEYETLTDCTLIDWEVFMADKVLPLISENLESTMLRITLEAYFKDVFLFMMSRLMRVEIGSDNESLWFHFGEQ